MSSDLYADLATVNGDLAITVQGDLGTVSGTDNLAAALQRRFTTPRGALFYDQTYGNPLLARLSQPMGRDFEQAAIADVRACMLGDSRVQDAAVQVMLDREQRTLMVKVSFKAKDGTTGSFEKGVSIRV